MTKNLHNRARTQTKIQAFVFGGKAALLRLRRGFFNFADKDYRRFGVSRELRDAPIVASSKSVLWTQGAAGETVLTAGKIHNLRLAVKRLNDLEIPANQTFSFWANVGRASRRRGFVAGRELREGCLIPNVGGGLCQLSNALYDAALQADFEIVERHRHSQIVAGSLAEIGRDATVFWNYVDLRFRSENAFRIEAELTANELIVTFKSRNTTKRNALETGSQNAHINSFSPKNSSSGALNNCATCGDAGCFRSLKQNVSQEFGSAAFLVDEFSPEFDLYLQNARGETDLLLLPLDGKRFKKANYAWTNRGFARTEQIYLTAFVRAYKLRKLAAQGALRQQNLLAMSEKLAASYRRKLPFDATHLIVQQNLLPFLWLDGDLGGRTFDVLMNALPMRELQQRLDFAAALRPESRTLGDFRADTEIVAAETEALKRARKIVTAHSEIADLFLGKSVLLDWILPAPETRTQARNEKFTIVFPASTLGRKGAFELREALREIPKVKLITLGAQLEGREFWRGFDVEHNRQDWLEAADLVVLPAFVEHKPRRLLQAVARGVPVIASKACGLHSIANAVSVEPGDAAILAKEINLAINSARVGANATV